VKPSSLFVLRAAVLGAALAPVLAVAACSSDPEPISSNRKTDAGANGDAGTSGDGRAEPYPSFTDDVLPPIIVSCSLTACHGSKLSNLNIFLPPNDPDALYAELQKTSPTTGLKFVAPGDPDNSYLMLKIEGKQATLSGKCPGGDCGTEMPPDTGLLPQEQRDAIRAWIAAGAKK
jgi:hypothetical protein